MYRDSLENIINKLDTSKNGLSSDEAKNRLVKNGKNEIIRKKNDSVIKIFFNSFKDVMILVLIGAIILSLALNEFFDAALIFVIIIINALISTVEQYKAQKNVASLSEMSSPKCRVLRDGKKIHIDTKDLVVGDIVVVEAGDIIPADGRLISSINLKVNESLLTGENLIVEKKYDVEVDDDSHLSDRINTVYSSTYVVYGKAKFVVTNTGMDTELGKIAFMILEQEDETTPIEKKMNNIGKFVASVVIFVAILILIIGLLQQRSFNEMIFISISVAVAAIPEGLPTVVSVLLALGIKRLSEKNAIVKGLSSVETLGSSAIICTDKTGTITQNKMEVVEVQENICENELAKGFLLCNDSEIIDEETRMGDPTELALIDYANKNGVLYKEQNELYPRILEKTFDSNRKCMSTVHKTQDGYVQYTKGAIGNILDISNKFFEDDTVYEMSERKKKEILEKSNVLASKSMRVLAVAKKEYKDIPNQIEEFEMTFIGYVAMIDPIRDEVKEAIESCVNAGIIPVMITGDNINTAKAVAQEAGLFDPIEHKAITGTELDKLDDESFDEILEKIRVYARVVPEQKSRIVAAWQRRDKIVAMTGDGVNDAPAIKKAEIGIAMGQNGTDISRDVSDMVLTDDNFATIVNAIKVGRGIYDKIRRTIRYLISCNIGEIMLILISLVLFMPLPLLPIHLLWINLISDGLPAIALGYEKSDVNIMKHKPYKKEDAFFDSKTMMIMFFESAVIAIIAFIAYMFGLDTNLETARTMVFMTLVFTQLVHGFNVRSAYSVFKKGVFSNIHYLVVVVISIILQMALMFVPFLNKLFKLTPTLSVNNWMLVGILSISILVITELRKLLVKG